MCYIGTAALYNYCRSSPLRFVTAFNDPFINVQITFLKIYNFPSRRVVYMHMLVNRDE